MRYNCQIEIPDTTVPQVQKIYADNAFELAEAISEVVHQWPQFKDIQVYDDRHRLVVRMMPDNPPILN
ncbi:MAG: hypothetical protein Q8R82_21080 [Hyphomonadaceae bacterium]|nr:hypothetical protein [Hyphomonadaceae bacterium]